MNILVVCQYYYPENFVITKICEELVRRGYQVDVLTGLPNYGFGKIVDEYKNVRYEIINNVKVHRVKLIAKTKKTYTIILNYLSFMFNAKKWVKKCKNKYDLVFSMSLSPVTILAPANLYKKKYNIKHICYCVDLWPESVSATNYTKKNSLFYKILYHWSRRLYLGADDIIIGSPSFRKYFNDVLKINSDRFPVLIQPSLNESSDVNKKNIFSDSDYFHILYCGNIGKIQMIDKIPEVMFYLKKYKIKFDIIGKGSGENKLKEKIIKYDVSDQIILHGPMPYNEASSYFSSCDVIYVSLKGDGYVGKTIPNKLIMSMAYSKPILGVLNGDGKDLISISGGGIIASDDPKDIAKKILILFKKSRIELKEMGERNKTFYNKKLSLKKCVDQIEKEFNSVLGGAYNV